MKFNTFAAITATAIVFAAPIWAENLAVVMSNLSYRDHVNLPSGPSANRVVRSLQGSGFNTILMQNQNRGQAIAKLTQIRQRMVQADRIVFVLNGHIVNASGAPWMLAPRAKTPTEFSIGLHAIPLGPLIDLAGRHQGNAILAVVEQGRAPKTGSGLQVGFGEIDIPQGVTFLSGPAAAIADVFDGGLLDGTQNISSVLAAHPEVEVGGFVPSIGGFLPAPAPIEVEDIVVEEPELTPAQLAEIGENDLGLSRNERRRVQQSLAILGFDPRGIDGVFGPGSRAAIRSYQREQNVDATGYLTATLVRQLFEQADARAIELEAEARQRQAELEARDTAYWRSSGQSGTEEGLRAYLERYPDGLFSDIAITRLEAIEDSRQVRVSRAEQRSWERATETDTRDAYSSYLAEYPDGAFASEAKTRIAAIQEAIRQEALREQNEETEHKTAGNQVARRLVESRLAALGLDPGPVDGRFDSETRRSLRQFQQARGLRVTGYVNQETMVRILLGQ